MHQQMPVTAPRLIGTNLDFVSYFCSVSCKHCFIGVAKVAKVFRPCSGYRNTPAVVSDKMNIMCREQCVAFGECNSCIMKTVQSSARLSGVIYLCTNVFLWNSQADISHVKARWAATPGVVQIGRTLLGESFVERSNRR